MDTSTVLFIAIPALVILGGVVLITTTRRRDAARIGRLSSETKTRDGSKASGGRSDEGKDLEKSVALERRKGAVEPIESAETALWTPPDPELIGVSRRQFFNRSMVGLMGMSIGTFGATTLAFLWPQEVGGFGGKINIGAVSDVDALIDGGVPSPGFSYFPEARSYVQRYPADRLEAAREVYPANVVSGMELGYIALFQKCPHLGCKVPECGTSQWFECPCHGSQYNGVGEKKAGPAPRGMDHFPIEISDGEMFIDTGTVVTGAAVGTDTTGQPAEGPHCLSGGH